MKRKTSTNGYFIRRIPADLKGRTTGLRLRVPLGATFVELTLTEKAQDVRFSLRTSDPSEVKVRQAAASAYVERVWQGLREADDERPAHLLQEQVAALAGEVYSVFMRSFGREPGPVKRWQEFRACIEDATQSRLALDEDDDEPQADAERDAAMEARFGRQVDDLLALRGLIVSAESRSRLLDAVARAERDVSMVLERRSEGDFSDDPNARRFPEWREPLSSRDQGSPSVSEKVRLRTILEDWWREAQATGRKPATYESYALTISSFIAFLKHDDATRVTPEDVVAFKDHRLASTNPKTGKPISAKTVKDNNLAALKAIFGWAVVNRRVAGNPAAGVTIKLGKKTHTRPKGFTDEEAEAVLKAADTRMQGKEHLKTFLAKRWVPWLCAYTGARVGEVVQLRREDVWQERGHWVVRITPEAGTVKADSFRLAVLHPDLVEKGFPHFVFSSPHGHLFVTPDKAGSIRSSSATLSGRIGAAARLVVPDRRVAPNHGWRHRFKSIARSVGIDGRVADAIQGHAPRTAGDDYGDVSVEAMALAMAKFPRQGGTS